MKTDYVTGGRVRILTRGNHNYGHLGVVTENDGSDLPVEILIRGGPDRDLHTWLTYDQLEPLEEQRAS